MTDEPPRRWHVFQDNVVAQVTTLPKAGRSDARLRRVRTAERADGEQEVAAQVQKLIRRDPRWRVLYAIPVGSNGSDIGHLVIGPGGVFTLNAVHHPGARIWVCGDTFVVSGVCRPYLRTSRHQAARASQLLTNACGVPVEVTGVVVPVGAKAVTVRSTPADVHVVPRRMLRPWLCRREQALDQATIELVHAHARRSSTWR